LAILQLQQKGVPLIVMRKMKMKLSSKEWVWNICELK